MNATKYPKSSTSKRKIITNLMIICFGFVLLFVAYNGLSMLQSTINQEHGIGVASQAITYAAFCLSALILPKYTIKRLGCKRTLLLSISFYIPYIVANFYFTWFTMVPSAILAGLASSLLWISQCTYFNECSVIYSDLCFHEIQEKNYDSKCKDVALKQDSIGKLHILNITDLPNDNDGKINNSYETRIKTNVLDELDTKDSTKDECKVDNTMADNNLKDCRLQKDATLSKINSKVYSKLVSSVTARFFGLFGLIFRSSDIWSNLISYYVLNDNIVLDNITENGNCSCGASFCNVDSNCFSHNLAEPTQQMRNTLCGVSVVLAFLSVILVLLFLDNLEKKEEPEKFSLNHAMATCRFVRRKEALFLLPLSAYIGLQQGFYIGDYTKSYIACAWGVYHVGLVSTCYGLFAGVFATLAGLLVKYIGRMPVMIIGAVINATVCIFLLIWNPLPEQPSKFFIFAAMWGAAVGILWSQIRAFYGVIFKKDEEAAFAGFYLWDSIGYCVAFSYSNYICTYLKIYILLSVSTLGMIGYLKTESIHIRQQKVSSTDN